MSVLQPRRVLKLKGLFSALLCLYLTGCANQFNDITSGQLQIRWQESFKNTAVSWWYLGEKNEHYYIIEKRPLEKHGYKIKINELKINLQAPKKLTFNEKEWVNLKVKHLTFL